MFQIALFEPCIAQNTGNIIRLIANNGCQLHLIEPLGFSLEEKKVRRAGLDYQDLSKITIHKNFTIFYHCLKQYRIFAITTKGKNYYHNINYQPGDVILFGSETHGINDEIRNLINHEHHLRIPMQPNNRSLNLSNSVALVSYEAWRQQDFITGV